jgi:uncharacterized membrane protein YdbT with pleckstrin-like domain
MRCTQCGFDTVAGAAFCSRCGTRMYAAKPAAVREYALAEYRPSLWYYAGNFLAGAIAIGGGAAILHRNFDNWRPGALVIAIGILICLIAFARSRSIKWSVTSDRLIDRRGILASRRREMELADIRSVEVSQRVIQRMIGLGDLTIASAASADYAIRLNDIRNPENAAETIRKARLKRLA